MSFWAYILKCADGSYYVGHTDDLDNRLAQHHSGATGGYTSTRRPVELVWSQDFAQRIEALQAERQIKGWSRAKKEALVRGDWDAVRALASHAKVLRDEGQPSTSSVCPSPQDERKGGLPAPLANLPVRPEEGLSEAEDPSRRTSAQAPVIILVRPQLGENIGKAARAMLNFGLTELRLVAPRDGWPNPSAGPAAAGADIVLERATLFDSVADAVADCAHVFATTVRKRGLVKPVVTPEHAAATIQSEPGRSALLFGPERSGLDTDDVTLARTIVTIPINPDFSSINLAQAVMLLAYEWSKHQALAMPPATALDPPAPQAELDGMIGRLEAMLDEAGYFYPAARDLTSRRTLRSVLTKPAWNANEVRTMRGVLSALKPYKRGE